MAKCKYCKELNQEEEDITIDEIEIGACGNYGYRCLIKYCPACGTMLNKYRED